MATKKDSSRISRESGAELLLVSAISLAQTTPISKITVRDIASNAGLQTMHLKRYFGSRNELLVAVCNRMMETIVDDIFDKPLPQIFPYLQNSSAVKLRLRIVSHLIAEGVEPKVFSNDKAMYMRIAERIALVNNASKRTSQTYAFIIQLILQGDRLMGDVNGISKKQRKDIFDLLVVLGGGLSTAESALGW